MCMCDWVMELGPKLDVLILVSKYEMLFNMKVQCKAVKNTTIVFHPFIGHEGP